MIVRLMLCKKHGGSFRGMKYQRWAETGVRCPVCEMERRALSRKVKEAKEECFISCRSGFTVPDGRL